MPINATQIQWLLSLKSSGFPKYQEIKSWLSNPENDFDLDFLKESVALLPDELSGLLAAAWLDSRTEALDFDSLQEALSLITDGYFRNASIQQQISDQKNNFDFDSLKKLISINSSALDTQRELMISSWVRNLKNNIDISVLKEAAALMKFDAYYLFLDWLKKFRDNRSLDNVKELLPLVRFGSEREQVLKIWFKSLQNNVPLGYLKEVLPLVDFASCRRSVVEEWLRTEDGKNCNYSSLQEILVVLANGCEDVNSIKRAKQSVVEKWMGSNPKNNFSIESLLELLPEAYAGNSLIDTWMAKPQNNLDKSSLRKILESNILADYYEIFIQAYVKNSSNDFDLDLLEEVLPLVKKPKDQAAMIAEWIKKPENSCSYEVLSKRILPLVSGDYNVVMVTGGWVQNPRTVINSLEEILFLSSIPLHITHDLGYTTYYHTSFDREKIAKACGDNPQNLSQFSSESLREVLPVMKYPLKLKFVQSWLSNPKNSNYENLAKLLPLIPNQFDRSLIAESWINASDEDSKYDNFVTAAQNDFFGSRYNYEEIARQYHEYHLPWNKIPNLCRALYPTNEANQTAIFLKLIKNADFSNKENLAKVTKDFVSGITNDDFVLQILNSPQIGRKLGSQRDVLEILDNRVHSNYHHIAELLRQKTLQESLTADGITSVKQLFGFQEIPQNVTLASLFSYHDLYGTSGSLKSIIKPEVLAEISDKFAPSEKIPYLTKKECEKLKNLIGIEVPEMTNLTGYLESRVPPIPIFTAQGSAPEINLNNSTAFHALVMAAAAPEVEKMISIGKSSVFDSMMKKAATDQNREAVTDKEFEERKRAIVANVAETKRNEINQEFRTLLSEVDNKLSASGMQKLEEKVVSFFQKTLQSSLGLDSISSSNNNKAKLFNVFARNKDELVFLFSKEGGFDKFAACTGILADGCVANIGTHTRIAVMQSLITDPCDQILYQILSEKIAYPILNSGGDLIGSNAAGKNIFTHPVINGSFISPGGLVAAIRKEFYEDGKGKRDCSSFIDSQVGQESADLLREALFAKYPSQDLEKKYADISAYLIIKKAIPSLLESKFLKSFKDECESIMREAVVIDVTAKAQSAAESSAESALAKIAEITAKKTSEKKAEEPEKKPTHVEKFRKIVADANTSPTQDLYVQEKFSHDVTGSGILTREALPSTTVSVGKNSSLEITSEPGSQFPRR